MQLEGHGSYWKAKILIIQEFWLLRLLLKKKRFFWPELPLVTLQNKKKLQNAEKSPIFNIQKLISPLFFNEILKFLLAFLD